MSSAAYNQALQVAAFRNHGLERVVAYPTAQMFLKPNSFSHPITVLIEDRIGF